MRIVELRPSRPLALVLVLVSACGIKGSGVAATETRSVESFDEIELGGAYHLIGHVGGSETKLTVSGDDNIVPVIETRVSGGKLSVRYEGVIRPERELVVEVWTPTLEAIDVSGAAEIDVDGLAGERFELDVSGAGEVELAGSVVTFVANISGAGELDAKQLQAEVVELDMSGAGEAKVSASKTLDLDISGAGEVDYWGSPEVRKNVTGAGEVRSH